MSKIKFAMIGCLVVIALGAEAQETRWGANIGTNLNMPSDEDTRTGFLVGAKGELGFRSLSEGWFMDYALNLSYIPYGWKSEGFSYPGNSDQTYHVDPWYLNIPVTAGYRFRLSNNFNLSVNAGLFGNVGLFGNYTLKGLGSQSEKGNAFNDWSFRRFYWGALAKVTAELKSHYQISLGFDHGFNRPDKNGFHSRERNLSISLGYMF